MESVGDGAAMRTPEIGHRDISFWWIWRNMGLDAALIIARATGRKYEPVSDERMDELLDYFTEVDDE